MDEQGSRRGRSSLAAIAAVAAVVAGLAVIHARQTTPPVALPDGEAAAAVQAPDDAASPTERR